MRKRVFVLLHVNLQDSYPYSATGVVEVYETAAALTAGIVRHKRKDLQNKYDEDPSSLPSDPEEWTEARVKGAWNAFFKNRFAYRYETVPITDRPEPLRLPDPRKPVMPRFAR